MKVYTKIGRLILVCIGPVQFLLNTKLKQNIVSFYSEMVNPTKKKRRYMTVQCGVCGVIIFALIDLGLY